MIVIILVKGAAKSGFSPVHCAVMRIDFFRAMCYDKINRKAHFCLTIEVKTMGQYFCWVNVDKKEYLCPDDFDLGNKLHESMGADNALLRALWELLSADWKGCRLVFLGDECRALEEVSNDVIDVLVKHRRESGISGGLFDNVYETYRNVNYRCKDAEKSVRDEIAFYLNDLKSENPISPNVYGIDINDPYRGLFLRNGRSFKYIVNRTKKVCYSLEDTKILLSDNSELDHADPLPVLMAYGGRRCDIGEWLGDIIDVSDTLPDECVLLKEIKLIGM